MSGFDVKMVVIPEHLDKSEMLLEGAGRPVFRRKLSGEGRDLRPAFVPSE
ncbi:MAG: hypothetical protein MZV70_58890 [Desulfobacterales bacterium]|nr:hypothetical protein [Desulfobacterales bacterium]